MRSRNIKPGFFKNEALAEIEPLGRILFAGLWGMADREGRLEDRPKRIKAEILPYDDCVVDELLNSLASEHFIIRYSVNGGKFIQVVNFSKHQSPHLKEADSTIPPPDLSDGGTAQTPDKHNSSPSDSFNPLTDSLNTSNTHFRRPPDEEFEVFWKNYPKKIGKKAAINAWKKAAGKPNIDTIVQVLSRQKGSAQWLKDSGQFIPNPATWLDQGRWDDEINDTKTIVRCGHGETWEECWICKEYPKPTGGTSHDRAAKEA